MQSCKADWDLTNFLISFSFVFNYVILLSSIGGVTRMRILRAPTQPASLQSAGWVGALRIRILDDSAFFSAFFSDFRVNLAHKHSDTAARRPGIYRCSEF